MPAIDAGPDIGAALKAAREFRGFTLQDVADSTRIRRAYLAAIEEMRLDELPSRPFTIGYIRAYARALGLDGEAAVNRFKADEPAPNEPLRAPVGVRRDGDPRVAALLAAGGLVVAGIVLWNVAQRAINDQDPPPTTAAESAQVGQPLSVSGAAVTLGAPLPAPVESTTPTLYKTPGLDEATANGGSADAADAAIKQAAAEKTVEAADADVTLPQAFVAQGAVYGAPASASTITLQALKPASLIVRGADGSVYFARQLAPGEAYRAPMLKGLTIDVSEPEAFQVFAAGRSKGALTSAQTLVSKLSD